MQRRLICSNLIFGSRFFLRVFACFFIFVFSRLLYLFHIGLLRFINKFNNFFQPPFIKILELFVHHG